jgi:hypothetical protein
MQRPLEGGRCGESDQLTKRNLKASVYGDGIAQRGKGGTQNRLALRDSIVTPKLEMVAFGPIERRLHCAKLDRLQITLVREF